MNGQYLEVTQVIHVHVKTKGQTLVPAPLQTVNVAEGLDHFTETFLSRMPGEKKQDNALGTQISSKSCRMCR